MTPKNKTRKRPLKDKTVKAEKRHSRELQLRLHAMMKRIRLFEEKIAALYPEREMKCPVHLCIGQEAIAAGVCANLKKEDYVFSNHRGHGHAIAKGAAMEPLMAEFYGKTTGCSRSKGGSMHIIDVEHGLLGTSAIVGGGIPMGVGAALASKIRGENRITAIFFGDGASEEGAFYESFNFASLHRLPVIFVCENNFYATNSHQTARQFACRIHDAAGIFDSPGVCVDGNDVLAVYDAAKTATERARNGWGPALIEAKTYRWKGHVGPEADHEKGLRPMDELLKWMERCPIANFERHLLKEKTATPKKLIGVAEVISKEVDAAVTFAKESPYPEPSELFEHVYSV